MNYLRSLLFCSLVLFLGNKTAFAQMDALPKMASWINDYGKLLNPKQVKELSSMVGKYDKHTHRGIIVVTVDSITPYTDMLAFANDFGDVGDISRRFKNSSMVIAICGPCGKVSIATGFGSGSKLKESDCKKIIDSIIIPDFQKGDYYLGLKDGIEAIIDKWGKK
jgi:uncharacterized protein